MVTTDSSILRSPAVDEAFLLGAKCRVQPGAVLFEDLGEYLTDKIDDFVTFAAESCNIEARELLDFQRLAIEELTEIADDFKGDLGAQPGTLQHGTTENAQLALRDWGRLVVPQYCDKHLDQLCLVCRRLYGEWAFSYIDQSGDTYVLHHEDELTVASRLAAVVQDRFRDVAWYDDDPGKSPTKRNPEKPTRIGWFHFVPKLHKAVPAPRPIVANPNKAEVPTARRVNAALSFLLAEVGDRRWHDLALSYFGLRLMGSSVLVGCEGVRISLLNRLLSRGEIDVHKLHFSVHDFAAMYTKFTHAMVLEAVAEFVSYGFRVVAADKRWNDIWLAVPRHDLYQKEKCFWCKDVGCDGKSTHVAMELGGLLERVRFLVENAYVFFGGEVYHQKIGLAMGLVPAGLFANVTCLFYELKYLKRVLGRGFRVDTDDPDWRRHRARMLFALLSQRYIDDCLHVLTDPAVFDSKDALFDRRTTEDGTQDGGDLDGIFPKRSVGPRGEVIEMPCELEQVHAPSRSVNFLDWSLTVDPRRGRIMTAVHDKRRGMACYANSRTFPHRDSVLPWRHKVGVVTSQFQRLARRESTMSGFLKEAANLAAKMLVHGYPPYRVRREVGKFRRYWTRCAASLGPYKDFELLFERYLQSRVRELRMG